MGAHEVGLVGLGLMGTAMSTRLLAADHPVVGYDIDAAAREAHAARGGELADQPADVAARCRVVILSLPNGQVSREVCFGAGGIAEGLMPADKSGDDSIVVETSTVLPAQAEAMAADLAAKGAHFADAALSGHSEMVGRGETLGMVGGNAEDLPVVEPILDRFCRAVMHVGGPGDGMRAKIVVNEILTINRFAVAEGLVLAEKMDMDVGRMLEVLRASAAYSKAMDMWGDRMVERRYTEPASRLDSHSKDARLTIQLGREHQAPMLLTTQINQVVQGMLANGLDDLDNSSVVEALRALAGIEPRLPTR
jgi:3-hydroxyisobutyrate dehydrogenase-like beta-hydroxyacid dehydrogenase